MFIYNFTLKVTFFVTNNKSRNVEAVLYHGNKNRDKFNFSVKAGMQFSFLYIKIAFKASC